MLIETRVTSELITVIPELIRQRAGIKEGHYLAWDVNDKTGEIVAMPSPTSFINLKESNWLVTDKDSRISQDGHRRLESWGDY